MTSELSLLTTVMSLSVTATVLLYSCCGDVRSGAFEGEWIWISDMKEAADLFGYGEYVNI